MSRPLDPEAAIIEKYRAELKERVQARLENQQRIVALADALSGVSRLVTDAWYKREILSDVRAAREKSQTLPEAIYEILRHNRSHWLSAHDVRLAIADLGLDLGDYDAAQSAILMKLKRLHESGRIARRTRRGRFVYRYIEQPEPDE